MSWPATPSPLLLQLRTQLVACASLAAVGFVAGKWHYPTANPAAVRGAGDALPLGVVEKLTQRRIPWLDGAGGLLAGEAVITLYVPSATFDTNATEQLAADMCKQLNEQDSGLLWQGLDLEDATNPSGAQLASNGGGATTAYRSITINLRFGPEPG